MHSFRDPEPHLQPGQEPLATYCHLSELQQVWRAAPAPSVIVTLGMDGVGPRGRNQSPHGWADGQTPALLIMVYGQTLGLEIRMKGSSCGHSSVATSPKGPQLVAGLQDGQAAPSGWCSLGVGVRVSWEGGTPEFSPHLYLRIGSHPSR